jgi:ketosteroid isomerase-like protein
MSRENVEVVRAPFDAFARRDHEAAFEYYDPDIEWDASRGPEGGASDIALETPPYALTFTFRDGKVVRWVLYPTQAEAREAAGLTD